MGRVPVVVASVRRAVVRRKTEVRDRSSSMVSSAVSRNRPMSFLQATSAHTRIAEKAASRLQLRLRIQYCCADSAARSISFPWAHQRQVPNNFASVIQAGVRSLLKLKMVLILLALTIGRCHRRRPVGALWEFTAHRPGCSLRQTQAPAPLATDNRALCALVSDRLTP